MALKKFGPNDLMINTLKAQPSFEFFVYDSAIYYNNVPLMSGANTDNILCTTGSGYISLYELNIDRAFTNTDRIIGSLGSYAAAEPNKFVLDTGQIYPFIIKNSSNQTFKTMLNNEFSAFAPGDIISGSTGSAYIDYSDLLSPIYVAGAAGTPKQYQYPMSASITREFMTGAAGASSTGAGERQTCCRTYNNTHGSTGGSLCIPSGPDSYSWPCTPYHRHFWSLKNRLNHYGITQGL